METTLPFQASVQTTGQAEIWDHTDTKKFEQFGWRHGKNDVAYRSGAQGALMGNWVEDRNDVAVRAQEPCIPSQTSQYYETNYDQTYGTREKKAPAVLKAAPSTRPVRAHPVHQPELDPPAVRAANEAYRTTNQTYGSNKG